MGQHYIPKYYLHGFCDPSKPSSIWVYEKGSERVFSTTVRRVANERNRWPQSVEEFLANQVEEPAKPVINKIRNHEPITQSDKEILSAYMVVMLQRVPRGLERTEAIAPEVRDQFFDGLDREILRLIEEHPSKRNVLQNWRQELPGLKLKYERDPP